MSELIKCTACHKKISINAEGCPNCGEPVNKEYHINKKRGKHKIAKLIMKTLWGIVGVIMIGLVYGAYKSQTPEGRVLQQKYEKQRVKQATALYKKVKQIPSSDIFRNKKEYSKLLDLDPLNTLYKEKYKYYSKKIEGIYNNFGERPIDVGMPYVIEKYIKTRLRDPDSLTGEFCNKSKLIKSGWEKVCVYRAKNGFGGYVKKEMVFIIKKGRVIRASPL